MLVGSINLLLPCQRHRFRVHEVLDRLVPETAPDFVKRVTGLMIAGKGDLLPVSAFSPDGTWPTGTTKWEKRNIALEIPLWDEDVCIQCYEGRGHDQVPLQLWKFYAARRAGIDTVSGVEVSVAVKGKTVHITS